MANETYRGYCDEHKSYCEWRNPNVLLCDNGHMFEATIKLDVYQCDDSDEPQLRFGEIDVYCAEDCEDIDSHEHYEAARKRFKLGLQDGWDSPRNHGDLVKLTRANADCVKDHNHTSGDCKAY